MKYAIKHPTDGYLTYDEDRIGEYSYSHEIDEFTITFNTEEGAKLACEAPDTVVALTNAVLTHR